MVFGEFEPKGLDSFAVRCEHYQMGLLQVQTVNQNWLLMRPAHRLALIDTDYERIRVVLASWRYSGWRFR